MNDFIDNLANQHAISVDTPDYVILLAYVASGKIE